MDKHTDREIIEALVQAVRMLREEVDCLKERVGNGSQAPSEDESQAMGLEYPYFKDGQAIKLDPSLFAFADQSFTRSRQR
jgi:hypothetical protein